MNLMNFFSSMTSNISDISSGSSLLRQPTFSISIPDLKISEPHMVDPRISLKPYTTVSKTPNVREMLRGTSFSNYDDESDWMDGKSEDDEPEPNWISENEDDGKQFYGYDDGEGYTEWYDEDGNLDCITETPGEDDECDEHLWRID